MMLDQILYIRINHKAISHNLFNIYRLFNIKTLQIDDHSGYLLNNRLNYY